MQTMQVCSLNTGNVRVETEMPLGECDCKNLQLHAPATCQNQQMDRIKRWPSGLRLGRKWFSSRTIGLLDVRMLEQSHPMV